MQTRKIGISLVLFLLLLGLITSTSLAVNELDLLELDRNAVDDSGAPLPDDWETLYLGGGSASAFTGIIPDIAEPGTQFQGGGSKDNNDISEWLWKPGEPLDKDDITNAYAAAYVNPTTVGPNLAGDLIVYYGLDRFANNGSAQVGFWFFQNPIGLTNTPKQGGYEFSGAHAIGDVLVQSNFSQGGVIDRISVYEWVGSGGSNGALDLVFSAADCVSGANPEDVACATVNQATEVAPWPYTPKFSDPTPGFPQGSFFEGGINISQLVPDAGCFTGFLAETRTSTPFDARLKDFAMGSFNVCSIDVTKSGDELSKVGDDVDYTITIENTGGVTLYKQSIVDSLFGDLTDGSNALITSSDCGASLAAGDSCTITVTRTVQEGDPDPLPNTVTVVYNSSSDLLGDEVTREDDHSVNLFQPSIAFDKSVSSNLSKVGDSVDYTLVLSNTSSADAPALDCTITDAALEINKSVTLASGEADTTMQSYTFQEGDSDPYDNTASVSCSPQGFPNVLPASDSESVNLFQPSIAFDKTGSQYSKAGDDVSYTLTLSNTSSGDTPDLVCTITDAMLEINKSVTLASGASDVTNATYTVQAGDPDPLENTASVSCSPIDFPNVLNDSDGHSVDLIHPSFTVAKSCVAEPISYLGPANFQVTIANTGDVPLDITADDGIGAFQLAAGASQDFDVSVPGPFTPGGTADNTVTASWTLPELYGLDNTDTKSASDSCDVLQPVYETAYALGDAATCFIDLGVNNWGWVNGDGMNYILPGDYIWPVWAGAAQCDTNNGTLVGTATVSYDGTDVSVTFDLDPQYVLGDTHIYAGYDQIPPGGFAPGQWQVYSPFDGSAIYIIVHAVVGIPQ
jgi:uncharacterized repeat protein (TIGR01451 family)